jgi:lysozyme
MKSLRLLALLILSPLTASAMSNSVVNMSHYDLMRVDFDLMRQQGIVGAIHEATYPPYVRDDKYFRRQVDATRAGLLWGAYHFANARDPVRQADFFVDTVANAWRRADPSGRPEQVLLVLDFERNGHYPGGTMRVEQAVAFVERVRQRTGKLPGFYSNENRIRTVLNSPSVSPAYKRILANCWLWVANYTYVPRDMSPWSRWTMWQYTGDGRCLIRPRSQFPKNIANIKNAERNMFYADRGSLRQFWQQHGWKVSE